MTAIERIRAQAADFPGYEGGVEQRRLAEQQVRAFVGERLSALPEMKAGAALEEHRAQYDRILMRCEFLNAAAFEHFEEDLTPDRIAAVLDADADLVDSATQLQSIEPADLDKSLTHFEETFDRRDAAMMAIH